MERVLEECDRASASFAPDPVHDLRVALRRCRSMVDGLMVMDPDPAWKQMKKAGKRLFQSLGELRDVHVMEEWVHHFDSPGDVVAGKLLQALALRETQLKQLAAKSLEEFDRKQWRKWCTSLPRRAARMHPGSLLFKHLALERWAEAHQLHTRALRNRSQVGWHSLRIGIKRFRYIVENFLPEQHALWGGDLKKMQDLLGEVHDLDVLWATAQQENAFPEDAIRSLWHNRIQDERERRIEKYRAAMVGKTPLWQVWRAGLPQAGEIRQAALQRLRRWASVLDPDFRNSSRVTHLALQLYDGLSAMDGKFKPPPGKGREILRLAAMLRNVGRSKDGKAYHKRTYRLLQSLTPPLGIEEDVLRLAAITARYHRGALPRAGQKAWTNLNPAERNQVLWLAGILRLANALPPHGKGQASHLDVQMQDGFILVTVDGYSPRDHSAEAVAAARHLLEVVCRCPVMVKPMPIARARMVTPRSG
jgi:CHAD domain-containing protein